MHKKCCRTMTFKCDTCSKYFEDADEFKKHIEDEFGWKDETKAADNKDIHADEEVKTKVKVKEEPITYKCQHCDKQYKNLKRYENHMNVPCNVNRTQIYYWQKAKLNPRQCLTCGQVLVTASALKLHISAIHEGQKYYCDQCDAVFTTKGNLQVHIDGKHRGKTYPCNSCDYKAGKKELLKKHVRNIHSTADLMCDVCSFKSNTKEKLRRHIRTMHEGFRYECLYPSCTHKATLPENLRAHIRDIHGPQNYKCSKCDFQAKRVRKMHEHRKSVHGEVITPAFRNFKKPIKAEENLVKTESIKIEEIKKEKGLICAFLKPVKLKIPEKNKVLVSFLKRGLLKS